MRDASLGPRVKRSNQARGSSTPSPPAPPGGMLCMRALEKKRRVYDRTRGYRSEVSEIERGDKGGEEREGRRREREA